jgi:hypothetical protein
MSIKIVREFLDRGYVKISLFQKEDILILQHEIIKRLHKLLKKVEISNLKNFHEINLTKNDHKILLNPSTRYINFEPKFLKFKKFKKKISEFFKYYWGVNSKIRVYWVGSLKKEEIKKNKIGFRIVRPFLKKEGGAEHTDSYSKFHDSFITIWVPLVGFDHRYTLKYAKKSHLIEHFKKKQLKQKEFNSKVLAKNYVKRFIFTRPKLKVGEAIIHHPNIIHGGSVNNGRFTRVSIEIRIFNISKYKKSQIFNKSYYY